LAPDDVHPVSLSSVGCDLDAFTHFGELNSAHRSRLRAGAEVLVKVLSALAVTLAPCAMASSLPQLFVKLPQPTHKVAALSANDPAASFERVQLDSAVLAFGDFAVETSHGTEIASRVDSYRHGDSETFLFRVGNEALSVATIFIGRPTLMHITIDGETYFVSPEGDHYVVAPTSRNADLPESVQYANVISSSDQFFAAAQAVTGTGRRRAVRSGPSPYRFSMQGVLATSYLQAVNERDHLNDPVKAEQIARDRMQHAFDYANLALANSRFFTGRWYLRQVVVRDLGTNAAMDWARTNAEIQSLRRANKACGTFIMAQAGGLQALRNSPSKVNPTINNAVAGGYFASWDDSDMRTTAHELGHVLGMDHNWEDAPDRATDPQRYARGKYDCVRKERDLMSYNRCGDTLTTLPIYSGPQVIWNGSVWGSEAENNVLAAVNVGPFLDESQITE
jgi:hypothetical protein